MALRRPFPPETIETEKQPSIPPMARNTATPLGSREFLILFFIFF